LGLDVYFHHTTVKFNGDESNSEDFRKFTEDVDKLAQKTAGEQFEKFLTPLREAWQNLQTNDYWRNTYNERYFTFVEKARPIICRNGYDWMIHPYTKGVLDLPELEELVKKQVEGHYEPYDAYFRKVNFIFKYYEDRGKMYDQYYAFTDASDIDDIIDRCERVLKNHDLANELLPTQSGFFFGGTDYDDWYFSDVKDCLKQMKAYRKLLKDGVTGYVIFSW
jgi:hypothetical protein